LPEHWELVGICLDYNLRHLSRLHRYYSERMTAGLPVQMALTGVRFMAKPALRRYLTRMKGGEPPN
jgi:hypothetical protein